MAYGGAARRHVPAHVNTRRSPDHAGLPAPTARSPPPSLFRQAGGLPVVAAAKGSKIAVRSAFSLDAWVCLHDDIDDYKPAHHTKAAGRHGGQYARKMSATHRIWCAGKLPQQQKGTALRGQRLLLSSTQRLHQHKYWSFKASKKATISHIAFLERSNNEDAQMHHYFLRLRRK